MEFIVRGNLVDVQLREIYPAAVHVSNGVISQISRIKNSELTEEDGFIMPGFIDSHVHIESSMLVPSEFAKLAVVHGTVATVSDPHEIANVCGIDGVEYMINNGNTVPFKFHFGAPSCVPATSFETAGDVIDAKGVEQLLHRDDIYYLSEMMNFPGVLHHDEQVMQKLASSKRLKKPIDGHAPGLRNEQAKAYIDEGISTDHECFTEEEALDKLGNGMKILIREGSAAKNFDALINLLNDHEDMIMFCSDDKHPDSLIVGHIDQLCARAVKKDIDIFKIIKAACINPVLHYKMRVGLLRENDPADFIVVKDLRDFKTISTYLDGKLVANHGTTLISADEPTIINNFSCKLKTPKDFIHAPEEETFDVIEALDGQLITNRLHRESIDPSNDILKIVVVNRYQDAPVAKAFIKGFGLKEGALASSVAHDSHNIVAVGVDDESLCKAVNMIIREKGGISAVSGDKESMIALRIAGLMSVEDGYEVARQYTAIDQFAKSLGSPLSAPFMTLSFMALLVIPHLKLSDKGLFDGDSFTFVHT